MTRTLSELTEIEKNSIIKAVHSEAELAEWSLLSNTRKSLLYRGWENRFNLSHATLKDGIMKGFDAFQGIPKKAEAEIQKEIVKIIKLNGIYVIEQAGMWSGKERADLLIGFNHNFLTHVIEIERGDSWSEGLRQVLWYQAAIFKSTRRHVLPLLLLFGNMTTEKLQQVIDTCNHQHVTLVSHRLIVEQNLESSYSINRLINEIY